MIRILYLKAEGDVSRSALRVQSLGNAARFSEAVSLFHDWGMGRYAGARDQVPEQFSQGVQSNIMTSKLVRFLMAAAVVLSVPAFAQTSGAAAPDAPSAAQSPAVESTGTGTKLGTINIEQAIYATNEGQRDFEQLNTKMQPKQTELKKMSDELDGLKKQLSTQGDKLSDMARGDMAKEIDQKQKAFDRDMQDARDDFQAQNNDVAQKILQKMAPIIMKYAAQHDFGIIIDTSNPWPQGPVLFAGPGVDITKPVVEAYNAQSGVAAPAAPTKPSATRPTSTRPTTHSGTTTK